MSNETKVLEVMQQHWKGILEYHELNKEEKENWKYSYCIEEIYSLSKDIFNLGLEVAAENAKLLQVAKTNFSIIGRPEQILKTPYIGMYSKEREGDTEYWVEVNKDSILNLKI